MTKGEKVLKSFELPLDIKYGEFIKLDPRLFSLANDPDFFKKVMQFGITYNTPMSDILDKILNILIKQDFIFSEKYRVVEIFDAPHGKWSNVIKDSVFIDCRMFHVIYANKISARILEIMQREMIGGKNGITLEDYQMTEKTL